MTISMENYCLSSDTKQDKTECQSEWRILSTGRLRNRQAREP